MTNPYEDTNTGIVSLTMLQELMQLFARNFDPTTQTEIQAIAAKHNHEQLGELLVKWYHRLPVALGPLNNDCKSFDPGPRELKPVYCRDTPTPDCPECRFRPPEA